MARPKKQDGEQRSETARFRVTVAEREYIRAQARAAGLPEAEYLRRRALGYAVPPARSGLPDPALISELNRIGVNVNQLARAMHRGSDFVQSWRVVGDELSSILAKVAARYGS
ncbi:MAG: plasmid mobilization relaxosome protein MobC [Amphiplicatus sp.]